MDLRDMVRYGTTTVGLVCKDGVVMIAERQATAGYLVAHKEVDKIIQIDSHLAITVAGSVADAQSLARVLGAEVRLYNVRNKRRISVEAAATLLSNILHSWRIFPYLVQILIGGYDNTGPRLFSLDPLGSLLEEKFVATGSGSPIAYGVLEDGFSEELTVKDGLVLALRAVKSATERDAMSGGKGFSAAIVTKDGFRRVPREEVERILSSIGSKS